MSAARELFPSPLKFPPKSFTVKISYVICSLTYKAFEDIPFENKDFDILSLTNIMQFIKHIQLKLSVGQ